MNKKNTPRVLQAIARDHLPDDVNLLPGILAQVEKGNRLAMKPMTKLITAVLLIVFVFAVVLASVPGAANAMKRLLGYIPGVGIVEQGTPIRVLAEPVSNTRDGITVSVNQATLTYERTQIDFGVSGVPLSSYPKDEATTGCAEQAYLRLPDGTQVALNAPLPDNVNEVVFIMPCVFNTLSGTTPVNWELPLEFVPAPPEMTVMPVIEPTLTQPPTAALPLALITPEIISTPVNDQPVLMTIDEAIQTSDGYILIGALRIQDASITGIQQKGVLVLRDADGQNVNYTHPQDIDLYSMQDWSEDIYPFAIQFQAAGISFPLTIEIPGAALSEPDPQATAEFVFDVGGAPQPGQEWILDQEIQLAGYRLTLASIRIESRNSYSFNLNVSENINSVAVQVEGFPASGAGGGGYYQGQIRTSVSFVELPRGELTFVFFHLVAAGETQTWQTQWQPDDLSNAWPTATPPANPVCLNAGSINQLPPLPDGLDGRILLTEMNPDVNLVIANLNGEQRQELPPQSSRGAFSPDGQKVAYPTSEGIAILDLSTNTTTVLEGQPGYDLAWSPDGALLAYVVSGDPYGLFVTAISGGSAPIQLSNLGYESLAGWSPDGRLIYYSIPGANGDGSFLLRSVDVSSGDTQDIFTLDDSSRKAPLPEVSPDGTWVAYRASDNSSLYLMAMDGSSPARLLIDNPELAINGIAWEEESHLLGVSLVGYEPQDGYVILLQFDPCEAYHLPGLNGELDGLFIP